MIDQLPALQVIVPLLAAPVCVVLRKPRLVWALTVAVIWYSFWNATQLLGLVMELSTWDGFFGGASPITTTILFASVFQPMPRWSARQRPGATHSG